MSNDPKADEGPGQEKHGLFVLYPPNDTEKAEVDIVTVHGLSGDAFRTWTMDDNAKTMWPRDLLPKLFPEARIMTFGYDSNWAFSRNVAGIEEFALDLLNRLRNKRWSVEAMDRPVIFICHSLGGIVCKKALILASEKPYFTNIFKMTRGIMFFGTPHRGSKVASWAKVMSKYINACVVHKPMRATLLKDLGPNSDALAIISTDFKFVASDLQIVTFYECQIMLPLKGLVVEKESAILGISNERTVPMSANHRSMVHFTHVDSQKFEPVRHSLLELIKGSPNAISGTEIKESILYAMEAFSVTDYYAQLSTVHTRSPGTCDWITSHTSFRNFLHSTDSEMLWLRGYAGVGKTVLAKHLIESALPSRRASLVSNSVLAASATSSSASPGPDVLAYFFCDDKDMMRKLEVNILKTILHQLLSLEPHLISALIPRKALTKWRFTREATGLWGALEDVILSAKMKTIYIVVDALDEMEPHRRGEFTAALGHLADNVGPHIAPRQLKVLITSRPEHDIEENLCCASIAVRSERDVGHYARNMVEKYAEHHGFPPECMERVIETIAKKAGTMFLWAELAWKSFREGVRIWSRQQVEERLKLLKNLPVGLESMYENILSQYDDSTLDQLMNVFTWLAVSVRPMTTKELEIAIAMKEDSSNMKNLDLGFSMAKQLHTICPNIMFVDHQGRAQFIHQSFKDFLLSPQTSGRHRIDLVEAHTKIAICCLRSFTFDDVDAGQLRDDVSELGISDEVVEDYGLLHYAAKNWPLHAGEGSRSTKVWKAYQRLVDRKDSLGLWWVLYRYEDRFNRQHLKVHAGDVLPLPLHIAVALKNEFLASKVLQHGADINQRERPKSQFDRFFKMHDFAVPEGFFSSTSAGGNALHIDDLDPSMIKFLFANGADITCRDNNGDTPLHSALKKQNYKIFRDLLEFSPSDADLNVKNAVDSTLIFIAINQGIPSIVTKLFNDPRIDLNSLDVLEIVRVGGSVSLLTPLEFACYWGAEAIVRLLLESDRVTEAQRHTRRHSDVEYPISLVFMTVLHGWPDLTLQVMELFPSEFEKEADREGRTILHHAAMENWDEVLDKFLERSSRGRLNKMDKNGMTALHLTVKARNEYAATRLLNAGAQPNVPNHDGKTPLHIAAEVGSEKVSRLLLAHPGIVVTELDNEKRTVLHYASSWDLRPLCEILLTFPQLDLTAKDRHGWTAAHLAAMYGCPGVLSMLLNTGRIGFNATDYYGNSLLHCAVEGKSKACIQELLWRPGLKLNSMNRYGKTPLDVTHMDKDQHRAQDLREFMISKGAVRGVWRPPVQRFDAAPFANALASYRQTPDNQSLIVRH